jgi:hypothetical protein
LNLLFLPTVAFRLKKIPKIPILNLLVSEIESLILNQTPCVINQQIETQNPITKSRGKFHYTNNQKENKEINPLECQCQNFPRKKIFKFSKNIKYQKSYLIILYEKWNFNEWEKCLFLIISFYLVQLIFSKYRKFMVIKNFLANEL